MDITRDEAALKEYLKPIPPTEPADAIKTFETAGGFRMELVAHEPLFTEPAGATFDKDGRMYVAEIVGYLYQPGSGPRGSCANVAFYPRAGFEALCSETPGARQGVLANYQATLTLSGDGDRGESVYRRECLKCHRLG